MHAPASTVDCLALVLTTFKSTTRNALQCEDILSRGLIGGGQLAFKSTA